jgi:hypothetical protein
MDGLEKELTERIAKDLGISPDEVTNEFILEWRDKHLYPHLKVSLNSKYGGYNSVANRVLTNEQIRIREEEVKAILKRIAEGEEVAVS